MASLTEYAANIVLIQDTFAQAQADSAQPERWMAPLPGDEFEGACDADPRCKDLLAAPNTCTVCHRTFAEGSNDHFDTTPSAIPGVCRDCLALRVEVLLPAAESP